MDCCHCWGIKAWPELKAYLAIDSISCLSQLEMHLNQQDGHLNLC